MESRTADEVAIRAEQGYALSYEDAETLAKAYKSAMVNSISLETLCEEIAAEAAENDGATYPADLVEWFEDGGNADLSELLGTGSTAVRINSTEYVISLHVAKVV